MEPNPYESPIGADKPYAPLSAPRGILSTVTRRIALVLFSVPLVLAFPVYYWAFHIAGEWFVGNYPEPNERVKQLGYAYLVVMGAFAGLTIFPGVLLLFIDNYRRVVTGFLMLPAFLGFALGMIVLGSIAYHYFFIA